jgi:hypothetical protein
MAVLPPNSRVGGCLIRSGPKATLEKRPDHRRLTDEYADAILAQRPQDRSAVLIQLEAHSISVIVVGTGVVSSSALT